MGADEYVKLAMRTDDQQSTNRLSKWMFSNDQTNIKDVGLLLMSLLGLSGEVGEFTDLFKKWIFHNSEFSFEHAKRELGDILWYVASICKAMNWSMEDIMETNINKLKDRYPDGFTEYCANHRKESDN